MEGTPLQPDEGIGRRWRKRGETTGAQTCSMNSTLDKRMPGCCNVDPHHGERERRVDGTDIREDKERKESMVQTSAQRKKTSSGNKQRVLLMVKSS